MPDASMQPAAALPTLQQLPSAPSIPWHVHLTPAAVPEERGSPSALGSLLARVRNLALNADEKQFPAPQLHLIFPPSATSFLSPCCPPRCTYRGGEQPQPCTEGSCAVGMKPEGSAGEQIAGPWGLSFSSSHVLQDITYLRIPLPDTPEANM